MFCEYNKLVFTGGVGVGKTTAIKNLIKKFAEKNINTVFVPEYIDGDPHGHKMLNKYLSGNISPFEFQIYIIEYYDSYLSMLNITDARTILIFERLPEDSIICFAKKLKKEGSLSDKQFSIICSGVQNLANKYSLPSYFSPSGKTNILNEDYLLIKTDAKNKVTEQIYSELDSSGFFRENNRTVFIGLYNTNEVCFKRVITRGEKSETGVYTIETITDFNKYYSNLFITLFIGGTKLYYDDY